MKNNVNRFATSLMQSIKADFKCRAKSGKETYTMEEILWIVSENIDDLVLTFNYDDVESEDKDTKYSCGNKPSEPDYVSFSNDCSKFAASISEYLKPYCNTDTCDKNEDEDDLEESEEDSEYEEF